MDWYVRLSGVEHDLRSSGLTRFRFHLTLSDLDMSVNYAYGNPEAADVLAERYGVEQESIFISSEGASGQNTRIIRCISERNEAKNEAIVEYPTYEPLLRKVQHYFPHVKRLERLEKNSYRLDVDSLLEKASEKTALLVITNPHAPSASISGTKELKEVLTVAQERGFFVLCDEIYAEFSRQIVPNVFSLDSQHGIVTTSLTKAYGLGGLKLGIALARQDLVADLYMDVLNTVGNSPNIIQLITVDLLRNHARELEDHKSRWNPLKREAEDLMNESDLEYLPNQSGVTYWVRMPVKDTYKWVNRHILPKYGVAAVPGAFFLYENGYKLADSDMLRIGLGNLDPRSPRLEEAFGVIGKALEKQ